MLINVLLIEDDSCFADLCRVLLARARPVVVCNIHWESTLSGAITYLQQLPKGGVDVILLDLGLPDSEGASSAALLAGTFSSIPVLVLSGEDAEPVMWEVIRSGAQDHIVKSEVNTNTLTLAILNAIARHADFSGVSE